MNRVRVKSVHIFTALHEAVRYSLLALKALRVWRKPSPVVSAEGLASYVESRAKFVSQTALYGYVRTRAGGRYSVLMGDDLFVLSVNIAKWEIYLACLCDLAVYAIGRVARTAGPNAMNSDEASRLAIAIVHRVLDAEEIPAERPQGFESVRQDFPVRARETDWLNGTVREAAFGSSLTALVTWAPIADELKVLDAETVRNSMRFQWKNVRDQLDGLLDGNAVLADWRAEADAPLP